MIADRDTERSITQRRGRAAAARYCLRASAIGDQPRPIDVPPALTRDRCALILAHAEAGELYGANRLGPDGWPTWEA